ncbi:hypothetical protein Sta7437_1632 [Stanieria cyanosphaera PCC 7437]|uniref:Uncharacterized protein n=1 Tax=Stanieria cyanosphaera (strain ATCC 29371 / PCC 7437) TaxID=111780 RepID=K9XU42_STAC7|nr:hypothetical protein [Stanieria cyanosphaera]AFZ35197.1 hypothetical protein Sta7437_1632 [Stanieria cyanosphaera PCC 7437]
MSSQQNSLSTDLEQKLQEITTVVTSLAETNQEDLLFLLSLLRTLELIHRQIRTEMFEPALPNSRNQLYHLVKDIEEQGGWPYIERMKLKDLLLNLESDSSEII